jgi:hypothetical protein
MRRLRHVGHARAGLFALSIAAVVLCAAPARAGDEAAAEALFLEAKRLMAEGKLAEACPKFAESNRLDRGAGTLIHLGDCYEKNHQTASAWATFRDAASAAQGLGRSDWEKLATSRAAALEPKLARLTIKVASPAEGITVTRDGTSTTQASWGVPIPVDIGMHVIEATAAGYGSFRATVVVSNDGARQEVAVPALVRSAGSVARSSTEPASTGAPPGADTGASDGSTQRTIGFVIGGIGIAGVAFGAITGLVAVGKNNESKQACPNDGACTSSAAVDANDGARRFGTLSTIGFIGGGAATVAGIVLVLTAPSSRAASTATREPRRALMSGARFLPATDGRSATMSLSGVF